MCVWTIGSFSLFGTKVKNHGTTQLEPWFFLVFSEFEFSLFIMIIHRGSHFGGGGPLPGPQGARRSGYLPGLCTVFWVFV